VEHDRFDLVIMLSICVSTILLAFESPVEVCSIPLVCTRSFNICTRTFRRGTRARVGHTQLGTRLRPGDRARDLLALESLVEVTYLVGC